MIIEGVTLKFALWCIFLGVLGQAFHFAIGMYKMLLFERKQKKTFDWVRFVLGLVLGAFIGGLMCIVYNNPLSKTDVIGILAAGYMGVDFIEGFFQRRSETV